MICTLFSGYFFAIWSCQNTTPKDDKNALTVAYKTALRQEPGEKNAEVGQLSVGSTVSDLNETSHFLSSITLGDTLRQEPWLRVKTADGRQGWVFAGALRPRPDVSVSLRQWTLQKRFQAWFGPVLAKRWNDWTNTPPPTTDSSFAAYLREGLRLRDTLNPLIARRVTRDGANPLPDLYWLSEMTPYFIIQQIGGGTTYYLYLDYRAMAKTAQKTTGRQDDLFCQLGFQAFPTDSIESALPVWVFPLSAEDGCSNLGQGYHLKILWAIDAAQKAGGLFNPELSGMKDQVLEDATGKDRSYWQPTGKILAELKNIRQNPPHCLSSRDLLALEARTKMFEDAAGNGIRTDLRSGQ